MPLKMQNNQFQTGIYTFSEPPRDPQIGLQKMLYVSRNIAISEMLISDRFLHSF